MLQPGCMELMKWAVYRNKFLALFAESSRALVRKVWFAIRLTIHYRIQSYFVEIWLHGEK